jgi:hypothetical protein
LLWAAGWAKRLAAALSADFQRIKGVQDSTFLRFLMYRKVSSWFLTFWATDRGLSLFLTLLLVYVFVMPSFVAWTRFEGAAADLFFMLLLVAGVAAVPLKRWQKAVMFMIITAAVVLGVVNRFAPSSALAAGGNISSLIILVLFSFIVIAQVFRGGPVTANRIKGAVAAYLLFGLTWASAYQLVASRIPQAFAGALPANSKSAITWIYFSFVTLTTVGYGDITPVALPARSLAVLEALTGQLYPAILIARLVSLELLHRSENPPAADGKA